MPSTPSARTRGPAPRASRSASSPAPTTTRWLPETATRCESPVAANASSVPCALSSVLSEAMTPAMRACASLLSGPMRPTTHRRTAMNASSGPDIVPLSVTRTRRMRPEMPRARLERPQSSSAFGEKRPTPSTRSPNPRRSEPESHTDALEPSGSVVSASQSQPVEVSLASPVTVSPSADTGVEASASPAASMRASTTPETRHPTSPDASTQASAASRPASHRPLASRTTTHTTRGAAAQTSRAHTATRMSTKPLSTRFSATTSATSAWSESGTKGRAG